MQQNEGNFLVPEPTPGSSKDDPNNPNERETAAQPVKAVSSLKDEVDLVWKNTKSILSNVNLALELEDSLNLVDVDAEKVLRIVEPELIHIKQHIIELKNAGEKTLKIVRQMIYDVKDKLTRIKDHRDKIHLEILAAKELSWINDHQPFTQALKQCSQLLDELSKQRGKQHDYHSTSEEEEIRPSGTKRPRVNKKQVEEHEHPANISTYSISLTPRKNFDKDLLALFYEVIKKTPMQVLWDKRSGKAATIYLRKREDMEKAQKELRAYKIAGKRLTSLIDIDAKASSRFAFKSSLMTSTIKNHLPFM